ncbi:MAG: biopolymer transporter ExbD [Blastocatellia bacterium]|nr:biopolymer transporter ExbD [Blastocatellia bacterium]MBN8722904.1 biopolymer transporter ExbD [Acidobacteriota bacterium]
MGMSAGGSGGFTSEINVTPMVDVMLVLLIIFMVVTPMLQSGVTVVMPKSKNSQEDPDINKETAVVVAIPADGQFYLGKELIAKERLTEKIKAMMENRKIDDRVVYIKGGALVSYGSIVDTISSIRESGIDRIGLVTDKEKEKAPGAASN